MSRFTCSVTAALGHQPDPEVLQALHIETPEQLHFSSENIVATAKGMETEGWILLPFCNTLCAEVLGAAPVLSLSGARVREEKFRTQEQIEQLSGKELPKPEQLAEEAPRLSAMMQAVQELTEGGNRVAYCIEGPFTLLSALIPMAKLFSSLRKPQGQALLNSAAQWIIQYAAMAVENGAGMISFADPIATADLLGEKMFVQTYFPICRKIIETIQQKNPQTPVHLCGKLTQSMLDMNLCSIEALPAAEPKSYGKLLCDYCRQPSSRLIGYGCLNRLEKQRDAISCIVWE